MELSMKYVGKKEIDIDLDFVPLAVMKETTVK